MNGWSRLYFVWAGLWFSGGLYAMSTSERLAERHDAGNAMFVAILGVPAVFIAARWIIMGFRKGAS